MPHKPHPFDLPLVPVAVSGPTKYISQLLAWIRGILSLRLTSTTAIVLVKAQKCLRAGVCPIQEVAVKLKVVRSEYNLKIDKDLPTIEFNVTTRIRRIKGVTGECIEKVASQSSHYLW